MKKTKVFKVLLILLILISIASYFLIPSINAFINNIFRMFASGDFKDLRNFIKEHGAYAVVISTFLMIFQSIAAPLPAFLITFANANLFGWVNGAILSFTSSLLGAAICFYIAKILGRDLLVKLVSEPALKWFDGFFKKYGKHSILIARLLPFISFDVVSYAAGLTSISFSSFIIATAIGQLPATIVYSYVGGMLTGGAAIMIKALLILFALTVLIFLFKKVYDNKLSKKVENEV